MDNENTTPTEEKDKDKKPEAEKPAEKAEETAEESKPEAETATETPSEAPKEQTEETTPPADETAPVAEPEQPESEPAPDPTGENEQLKATVAQLTAELDAYKAKDEARKAGFRNEFVDDAVILATHGVKDGTTIAEALQAVANRHPDWKHTADDKGKNGFKVGAEPPKDNNEAVDTSLDEAFGIRRKK